MKNNMPYKLRSSKSKSQVLSVSLIISMALVPIIYTQASAQNSDQPPTASKVVAQIQSSTVQLPTTPDVADKLVKENDSDKSVNDSYGFEALTNSFSVAIDLPVDNDTVKTTAAQLVKFSSLTPSLLALIMSQNASGLVDKQNYRVIDAKGHVMPAAIRPVAKKSSINQVLQVVSVETDNPNAVEKLRQALTVQLDNATQQQSINIDLNNLASNQVAAITNNPVRTWWLTNPNFDQSLRTNTDNEDAIKLWLKFSPIDATQPSKRPLQLQIYGSDDLQSWQMVSQSVISPFDTDQVAPHEQSNKNSAIPTGNAIAIEPQQANYRYWQVVANQPINLEAATINRVVIKPSFFLTRANFTQDKTTPNQWQLNLNQPMLTTGLSFFIPENQLWQVSIKVPEQDVNQLAKINKTAIINADQLLANNQLDKNHTNVNWQPTLTKSLRLTGQMQQDDLPVNLMTPMYEMYFLAQGTAPYQVIINEPTVLEQPNIQLSDQQIASLGNAIEGQMQDIDILTNPNAMFDTYKQWALWGVLAAIVAALAWIAMRLYQQTTTQAAKE